MNYPFTARKHVGPNNDGSSVDAPNITDNDPATTDTIFCRGGGGPQDDDWFILDMGAESSVGQVQLINIAFSALQQGASAWVTDNPAAWPGGTGTAQLGVNWLAGAATSFPGITLSGPAVSGRYVLVLGLAASGQSMTLGAASIFPPVIPIPTLTATPSLPGGVPSIILQGF